MRNELLRSRQLLRLLAVILFSLLLAACGSEDGEETPTATSAPAGAQPTVAERDETPVSSPATSVPDNTDMSTAGDAATPVGAPPGIATPAPATPGPGNTDAAASPVAGAATPASGTPTAADPVSSASGATGDGTSGAMVPGTPVLDEASASPVASPASPVASPVAALAVSGCEVPDVPPFAGDVTTFRLTEDLNFRTGPGPDCELALPQPIGAFQVVEVIGGPVVHADDGSQWVLIRTLDTDGWIAFEFLEPAEE